jgi:hypothetical protein
MSSHQSSAVFPAQPPWKRYFNIIFCGLILSGAAVVNISTQMHLSGRIPDWAGLTWIIPIASWLYSIQCTVNWATSAPASPDRKAAFHSVLISVGIAEAMNLGEHIWAYVLEHGKLDWGVTPSLLVGSLPAMFDFLSIESAARVLSAPHVPTSTELSEAKPSDRPEISEPPVLSDPVPSDKPAPLPEDPAPKPLPKPDPAPELPAQPLPEPNDGESTEQKESKMSAKRQARERVIDAIARMVVEKLADGRSVDEVKKELTGPVLESMFPDVHYDVRSWQNHRNKALDRVAASQGAA